jgi:cytoskeletal protein CcmA (bactofilin family)
MLISLRFKNKNDMAKYNDDSNAGLHNVLAVGTVLTGKITAESDFRLDGRIEGEIECRGKIVIGPKGSVKGNISTINAEIFGSVDGTIKAKERLILRASAVITGDIDIQTFEVEPGAKFNGTCKMGGKEHVAPTENQQQNGKK